jgi:hypothetical protein
VILRWIDLLKYNQNNFKAFVLLDVLFALGLMAVFLIIIYQLKMQNIARVENINDIMIRERAVRNFLVAEQFIFELSSQNNFHEEWVIKTHNENEVIFVDLNENEYVYTTKSLP